MIFNETELKGAFVIELEKRHDSRGFFGRAWCRKEFEKHGCNGNVVQANISYNRRRGTLRGMHYQEAPFAEGKALRCSKGGLYTVIIDLRPQSATYLQWVSAELTGQDHRMLYIPEGFATGFQTLEDHTEAFYLMTEFYSPAHAKGIRWDDPAFCIEWPKTATRTISDKDQNWPAFVG